MIRSPGGDGVWDREVYRHGSFDPEEVDHDVVWGNGLFVQEPKLWSFD